jgi:hypothetical protein
MKRILLVVLALALASPVVARPAPLVPIKNAPTALGPVYAIWQATWAKAGGVYTAVPRPNPRPPLPTPCPATTCHPQIASAQASNCDTSYGPPTAQSCHGWWTQRQDVWEGGSCGWNQCFRTYWRVIFWTNQNNTAVTHVSVYCEATGGYYAVDQPCTTSTGGGPAYSVPWTVDWWFQHYPYNVCGYANGELHAHVYVRGATVNAKHQVQGTAYRLDSYQWPGSC